MRFRRRHVPSRVSDITEQLTRERVLAVARVVPPADVSGVEEGTVDPLAGDGTDWAVATRNYVVLVRDGVATGRPWCDVDRASLDPLTANLTINWADGSPASVLLLADRQDPRFASVLHERVQFSVVLAESVRLPDGQRARVAVRRDAQGELFSQVIGPGTIQLSDPATVAAIEQAETRIRDACGLPL